MNRGMILPLLHALLDLVLVAWIAWLLYRKSALFDRADAAETEIARRNERDRQLNKTHLAVHPSARLRAHGNIS